MSAAHVVAEPGQPIAHRKRLRTVRRSLRYGRVRFGLGVLLLASVYVIVNLVADLLTVLLVPRLRTRRA